MKYGYYPGCSLHSTGIEYDESFRAISERLGIELEEIEGWTCCGSSPAHVASHLLSIALPIRDLMLAEAAGHTEVTIPCAACYSRFSKAQHETRKDPELAKDVEYVLGAPYGGAVKPIHPLEILSGMLPQIAGMVTREPLDLRVACYYGCLLVRPPEVTGFDDVEYPMSMDTILRAVGIETVEWSGKTDCCGAALAFSETDIVLDLTREIFEQAVGAGANAIAVACPLCHVNLDTRQTEVEAKYGATYKMPVFYFTQLLGLTLGIEPKQLGLHRHLVSPTPLLAKES